MTRPTALAHPPALLSADHAAAYPGISATLLRELAARGEAPGPVRRPAAPGSSPPGPPPSAPPARPTRPRRAAARAASPR